MLGPMMALFYSSILLSVSVHVIAYQLFALHVLGCLVCLAWQGDVSCSVSKCEIEARQILRGLRLHLSLAGTESSVGGLRKHKREAAENTQGLHTALYACKPSQSTSPNTTFAHAPCYHVFAPVPGDVNAPALGCAHWLYGPYCSRRCQSSSAR